MDWDTRWLHVMMKTRITRRLDIIFSITVFVVMMFTMLVLGFIIMFFHQLSLFQTRTPLYIISIVLVSIVIGILFSKYISRSFIQAIEKISEATIQVSEGNFEIHLEEENMIEEIEIMSRHFNLMVKELQKIDTLSHEFINNISHEFKTPVSAIEGYASLLQNPNLDKDKRDKYTKRIVYNTKRLTTLTSNILELSKLDNDKLKTKKTKFQLDEQIREVILSLETQWEEKNIDLLVDLEDVMYLGNENLIVLVWENLISNAIKFVELNGLIDIKLLTDSEHIIVTVEDDGEGIKNTDRIFERFYQEERAHSTPGNGLGLALVHKIVTLENGTIQVESQKNLGTRFTIKLKKGDLNEKIN